MRNTKLEEDYATDTDDGINFFRGLISLTAGVLLLVVLVGCLWFGLAAFGG